MQPLRKFDAAQFYYWSMHLIEPANPDDDCYVMLRGDEGEILGPMTMRVAEQCLQRLNSAPAATYTFFAKSA